MRPSRLLHLGPGLVATALSALAAVGCSDDIAVLTGSDSTSGTTTGSGGSGGTTTTGSTTGTGGAGAAGGAAACASFALAGPPVYAEPPNVGDQSSPALTLSRDDSTRASLAFQHTPYLDLYAPEVSFVSFVPWGAWSAVVAGPSGHAIAAAPASFAVSQTPGDSFNALSAQGDGFVAGTWFVPRVIPEQTPPGAVLVSDTATRAAFVASRSDGASRHLLGLETSAGGGSGIAARPATSSGDGSVDLEPEIFLGCASSGPMPADAVPSGTAWLVAFANGASSPGCFDPELPGPPHAIHVVRILDDGTFTTGAMLPQGGPLAQIAMAGRSDGAWLVWQRASGGKIAPIQAVRLDLAGDVVFGPVDVVPSESEPGRFAVDRLGDELAIAYEALGLSAEAPSLVAGRVGDDGVLAASATLDGPILTAPPSVLASPSGDQILVAYGVLGDHPEVAVARFDCAHAP